MVLVRPASPHRCNNHHVIWYTESIPRLISFFHRRWLVFGTVEPVRDYGRGIRKSLSLTTLPRRTDGHHLDVEQGPHHPSLNRTFYSQSSREVEDAVTGIR